MHSWRNQHFSWPWKSPFCILLSTQPRTSMVLSSPFFCSLLYKDPDREMGEGGGEGVATQEGKPEEQHGGGAVGEEPNQLSQW